MFLISNYLDYKIKSINEHSVHSPFVFDLLLNVIYDRANYYSYQVIETVRTNLLQSKKIVFCDDLESGSIKSNSKTKTVNELAKIAAKPAKYAQLLFRLVNRFQPTNIIELGTSLGISTSYLAAANSKIIISTIEGCGEIAQIAKQNFEKLKLNNIEPFIGNFDDLLPVILEKKDKVGLVFFDGNHRKEPTLNYFKQCLDKANENSVFIFDDIYWSPEMKEAWEEIKKNEHTTVTIDLFYMGIVFFKKDQVKEHFMIQY